MIKSLSRIALLAALAAAGCAAPPPATLTISRAATRVSLAVNVAPGRALQTTAHRWTADDVQYYQVQLLTRETTGLVPTGASTTVVPPRTQATFTNLEAGKRYVAVVTAWGGGSPAVPLNTQTPCSVDFDFSAGQDLTPNPSGTATVTFDGTAFSGSASIAPTAVPAGTTSFDVQLWTRDGTAPVLVQTYDPAPAQLTFSHLAPGPTYYAVVTAKGAGGVTLGQGTSTDVRFDPQGQDVEQAVTAALAFPATGPMPLRGEVSTFAGNGTRGYLDASIPTQAWLSQPTDVAFDATGDMYFTDTSINRIRKISTTGTVSTLAGDGFIGNLDDPFGTSANSGARFQQPGSLAVDATGNVYVTSGNRIRKITPAGAVTTLAGSNLAGFADGPAGALFYSPHGLAVDRQTGDVYVADCNNQRIRKISPDGYVSTVAGTGTPGYQDDPNGVSAFTLAQFSSPYALALDAAGTLYVAEAGNNLIRKVTRDGAVTTLAGTGQPGFQDDPAGTSATTQAQFEFPSGLAVDPDGNVYVSDMFNFRIRKIAPAGAVTTVAGEGTPGFLDSLVGASAEFNNPRGLALDAAGALYVADSNNYRIRVIR